MTNKILKIREEIEKLKSQLLRGACSSQIAMETYCKEEAYNDVLAILDNMQEESVSEDLEKEIDNYIKKNGYDILDPIEEIKYIANYFANWKEQQMLKNSISKSVCLSLTGHHVELDQDDIDQLGLLFGDKIKLIATKDN